MRHARRIPRSILTWNVEWNTQTYLPRWSVPDSPPNKWATQRHPETFTAGVVPKSDALASHWLPGARARVTLNSTNPTTASCVSERGWTFRGCRYTHIRHAFACSRCPRVTLTLKTIYDRLLWPLALCSLVRGIGWATTCQNDQLRFKTIHSQVRNTFPASM